MARFTFGQQFSSGLQNERDRQLRRQAQRAQERLRSRKIQQTKELAQQRMQNQRQLQEDEQSFRRSLAEFESSQQREQAQQNLMEVPGPFVGLNDRETVKMPRGTVGQIGLARMRQQGQGEQRMNLQDLGYSIDLDIPVNRGTLPFIIQNARQQRKEQRVGEQTQEMLNQIDQTLSGEQDAGQQRAATPDVPSLSRRLFNRTPPGQTFQTAQTALGAVANQLRPTLDDESRQTIEKQVRNDIKRIVQARQEPQQRRAQVIQEAGGRLQKNFQNLSQFEDGSNARQLREGTRLGMQLAQMLNPQQQQGSGARRIFDRVLGRIEQRLQSDEELSFDQLVNTFKQGRKAMNQLQPESE